MNLAICQTFNPQNNNKKKKRSNFQVSSPIPRENRRLGNTNKGMDKPQKYIF